MLTFERTPHKDATKTDVIVKEIHWSRILREIERGEVVPVVGPELLETHDDQGNPVSFYELIAGKLVSELGIETEDLPPPWSLCELVYLWRKQVRDPLDNELYHYIYDVVSSTQWKIPDSLRKLASIEPFRLFISTTPDNLLVDALKEQRNSVDIFSFSPESDLVDLPDSFGRNSKAPSTVFKLFGDIDKRPELALTEEDILRFVHHLQIKDERPANLFDILRKSSLAMLGCSFENWLIRFLLCSVKSEALFTTSGARGIVADSRTKSDLPLLPFLNRNRTLLFAGTATEFVDQLHSRWKNYQASKAEENANTGASSALAPTALTDDFVFISYASEDKEAALRIRDSLEAAEVPTWLDEDRLESGNFFEEVITEKIKQCAFFLSVISQNTATVERRFFRMEWNLAIQEAKQWPTTHPFLLPVIIDDTSIESETLPREFRERHCSVYEGGQIDSNFSTNLLRALRRYQQRLHRK